MAIDLKHSLKSMPIVRRSVDKRMLVVAIDFGTTYSGYAFSFSSDFEEDPLKVNCPQWEKGKSVGITHQTSTCALFTPKGTFHSFGYDAEAKYNALANDARHCDWYYFRHFKMCLYDKPDLSVRLDLRDDKGNSLPAIEVFASSIQYFKDHFLKELERKKDSNPFAVSPSDIHWVLTVPAIWDDKAKQFMREAAIQGGIHTDQLLIALEPEAASLFCRYVPLQRVGDPSTSEDYITNFGPGDKYMVLDAGGGTIDITVHEIQQDETLKELYAANGGEWGGTSIDKKFGELLNDIIGPDTMEVVAIRFKDDLLDMLSNFEIKKRTISPENNSQTTIRISQAVNDMYKELNGGAELKSGGKLQDYLRGHVTFGSDKVRVDAEIMKGLFAETIEQTVNHISRIFGEREVKDVRKVLMVGGFSESKMLQDAMMKGFPDKVFIVPDEPGLAVVRGAVMFGHSPNVITARVLPYTYGIKAIRDFQPGLDRPERRVVKKYKGVAHFLCENTFDVHAMRGERMEMGEPRGKREYLPSEEGEKTMRVSVYRSTRRMPIYTDENESQWLGDIDVPLLGSKDEKDRPVTVEMVFGKTELSVQVVEKNTGKPIESKFDCLRRESTA